jgi:hypothetical protein
MAWANIGQTYGKIKAILGILGWLFALARKTRSQQTLDFTGF